MDCLWDILLITYLKRQEVVAFGWCVKRLRLKYHELIIWTALKRGETESFLHLSTSVPACCVGVPAGSTSLGGGASVWARPPLLCWVIHLSWRWLTDRLTDWLTDRLRLHAWPQPAHIHSTPLRSAAPPQSIHTNAAAEPLPSRLSPHRLPPSLSLAAHSIIHIHTAFRMNGSESGQSS